MKRNSWFRCITRDPARIDVVHPGVDLQTFSPGDRRAARAALGLADDEPVVAFVGRIQPLKAPDVLLRAAARLPGVRVMVAGGPSGSGLAAPDGLMRLADELGITASGDVPAAADAATNWSTSTAPPIWWPCPVTPSRSAWWPSRRRPAAPRWWRPRSAVCRWRSVTVSAACWSTATIRPTGPTRSPVCSAATRDGRAAMSAAAVAHAAHVLVGPHRRRPAGRLRAGHHRLRAHAISAATRVAATPAAQVAPRRGVRRVSDDAARGAAAQSAAAPCRR